MKRKLLLFVTFFFGAVVTACQVLPAPVESMETTDRATIEENTDIFVPKNIEDLHGYLEGAQETTMYIKFVVRPEDVDSIVESSVCDQALKDNDPPWSQSGDNYLNHLGWWSPEKAKTYLWCYGELDTTHQTIFFDTTDPEEYIVYVVDSWY